jgi:hypothetical protein
MVGPEFGLDENDECRVEDAEVAAESEAEVEREVEDRFLTEAAAGELLAGSRGGGDDDAEISVRQCFAEFQKEGSDGEDFADGDGMDPNGGVAGAEFTERCRRKTEALCEPGAMAGRKSQQGQPERQSDDGGESEREAVEGVHAVRVPVRNPALRVATAPMIMGL